jgi:hypothetical protein
MDIETPAVYGYGRVLAKAVRDGKVPKPLLNRSVCSSLHQDCLGLRDHAQDQAL